MAASNDRRREWLARAEAARGGDAKESLLQAVHTSRSRAYVRFLFWGERRALVRALGQVHRGGRVLEVGCGPGMWFSLWRSKADELHGTDFILRFAAHARREGRTPVSCGDMRALPYKDGSFSMVTTVKAIQHVEYSDHAGVFAELFRVLKPGGHLLTLELTGSPENFGKHIRPRPLGKWIRLAQGAGFHLVWRDGNEYSPLLRGLERLVFAIKKWRRSADGDEFADAVGPPSAAHRTLRWIEACLVYPSWLLEPLLETILPASWAGHGAFVYRRPG